MVTYLHRLLHRQWIPVCNYSCKNRQCWCNQRFHHTDWTPQNILQYLRIQNIGFKNAVLWCPFCGGKLMSPLMVLAYPVQIQRQSWATEFFTNWGKLNHKTYKNIFDFWKPSSPLNSALIDSAAGKTESEKQIPALTFEICSILSLISKNKEERDVALLQGAFARLYLFRTWSRGTRGEMDQ